MGFVVDVEPAALRVNRLRETGEKLLALFGCQHPMVRSRAQEVDIGRAIMPPDPRIASVLDWPEQTRLVEPALEWACRQVPGFWRRQPAPDVSQVDALKYIT
jgi:hypothetical protein